MNPSQLRYAREKAKDYERKAERRRLAQVALGTPLWKRTLRDFSLLAHLASLFEWLRG